MFSVPYQFEAIGRSDATQHERVLNASSDGDNDTIEQCQILWIESTVRAAHLRFYREFGISESSAGTCLDGDDSAVKQQQLVLWSVP